jgi:hypothetical protein
MCHQYLQIEWVVEQQTHDIITFNDKLPYREAQVIEFKLILSRFHTFL